VLDLQPERKPNHRRWPRCAKSGRRCSGSSWRCSVWEGSYGAGARGAPGPSVRGSLGTSPHRRSFEGDLPPSSTGAGKGWTVAVTWSGVRSLQGPTTSPSPATVWRRGHHREEHTDRRGSGKAPGGRPSFAFTSTLGARDRQLGNDGCDRYPCRTGRAAGSRPEVGSGEVLSVTGLPQKCCPATHPGSAAEGRTGEERRKNGTGRTGTY